MTDEARKIPPLPLVLTEIAGTLLTGLGVAEAIVKTELVPEALRFDHYGWVMAAAGIALMLPMLFWVVRNVQTSQVEL